MLFAVTGSPILQSKSPDIWNSAFSALGIDAVYFRIAVKEASKAVRLCEEIGVRGLNVTAPYKEEILKFVNDPDIDVRNIGAANAVIFEKGRIKALNTDWMAVRDILLERWINDLDGESALVIGAGGAARAAVYALKKLKADVLISNRTEQKAKKVASFFNIGHLPLKEALKGEYTLAVNCTPHHFELFKGLKTGLLIDAAYQGIESKKDYEAGEEWLLLQAETFFKTFFDAEPLEPMRQALKRPQHLKKHVALTGFMGAGKSYTAKKLAQKLGYELIDLDEMIEKKEGMSVTEIFSSKGGEYFRKIEKELLLGLELKRPTVLATGGGTVIDPENRAFLSSRFKVIWLWANLKTILNRVDKSTRPLFKDNAGELLKSRISLYAKACDVCVNSDDQGLILDLSR